MTLLAAEGSLDPGVFTGVLAAATLASAALAEAWRRWALRRGIVDVPGQRSSHAVPTPRGGGVGPVLAVLAGLWLLLPPVAVRDAAWLSIAAASAVGLWDDLAPLPPLAKLAGQLAAALPLAFAMPWPTALLPFAEAWAAVAAPLTAAVALGFAVLMVNAWNFMDGINGIATLAAMAVAATVLAAGAITGGGEVPMALPALLLAAGLGFLPLNLPRARVFMGDCGSHGFGMAMAALVLWPSAALQPASNGMIDDAAMPVGATAAIALAAASPFLVDVLCTLWRRIAAGERLTEPHRDHLYQRLVHRGYSHARVAAGYAIWMLASGGVAMAIQAFGGSVLWSLPPVVALNVLAWWRLSRRRPASPAKEGHR